MDQEAPDELLGVERHGSNLVPVFAAIILPAEGDAALGMAEDPIVGQGQSVGVAGEILNGGCRSSERFFRVDDPFGISERIEVSLKGGCGLKLRQFAKKRQVALLESLE